MRDEPTKLCDGCGKDLSNGGGYADEPHVGFPKFRCAPCKIAKDSARIAVLELAAKTCLSDLDEVLSSPAIDDALQPARRSELLLREVLTDRSYPSRTDGKVGR